MIYNCQLMYHLTAVIATWAIDSPRGANGKSRENGIGTARVNERRNMSSPRAKYNACNKYADCIG